MSRQKAVRFVVRFIILGAAAGTLGGYSSYAMRPSRALPADPAANLAEPQVPNRAAKTDRLPPLIPTALAAAESATYSLASAVPTSDLERFYDAVTAAAPVLADDAPSQAAAPATPAAEQDQVALAATPLPPQRPRHLPPPPPAPSAYLDDTQIAGIRHRLRLTSDQAEYWPAVETALRDVVRKQMRPGRMKQSHDGKADIDVNSPEVQRLIWAAMPLLMRLREDQKREVRKLARVIGLDAVASQI